MPDDDRATQQSVVEGGAGALREAIPDVIKGYGALTAATYVRQRGRGYRH